MGNRQRTVSCHVGHTGHLITKVSNVGLDSTWMGDYQNDKYDESYSKLNPRLEALEGVKKHTKRSYSA
jgi:hypothetical protein